MRNYSFSNIASEQSFGTRKSNDFSNIYRHSDLKNDSSSRIDQIKKKYDTPSRRNLRNEPLKQSKDFELQRQQEQRDNTREYRHQPAMSSNLLKQSFAVNRLEKNSLKFDADAKQLINLRGDGRSNQKENDYGPLQGSNRQDEAAIFSKVREMKESIVNQEYSKPLPTRSSLLSSSSSFNKYSMPDKYQGRREFDPRVENIDKINSKIKQILSCLSENEKHQQKYTRQTRETTAIGREEINLSKDSAFFGYKARETSQSKPSYQANIIKGSDLIEKLSTFEQKPQIAVQKPTQYEPNVSKSFYDNSRLKNRDYSLNRVDLYSKDHSVSRPPKPQEEVIRTPTYLNKESGLRASRSRSQIDSYNRLAITPNDAVLKSGKKVDDEISRIQKKIEEFEKEKRKLNIEFTPFTLKNKSTANLNLSVSKPHHRQSEDIRDSSKDITTPEEPARFTANQRSSSNDLKFKSYLNRAADYSQKYGNFANKDIEGSRSSIIDNPKFKPNIPPQEDFELKIQKIEVKYIQADKHDADCSEDENNYQSQVQTQEQSLPQFDQGALKRRTDEGIQERRRRRQNDETKSIIATETLKNIVSLFCQQVKLDQNLRNMKIWLESCFQSDKSNKISKALSEEGVQITPEQCGKLFAVDESENNPFFSIQGFQGSYKALAQAYSSAQRHWKNSIQHKFDRNALVAQGFTSQKIDLQRKGFIELEDLVRFLNIESGTFFRNRDLFLIFRRLTVGERVQFQRILDQVCS